MELVTWQAHRSFVWRHSATASFTLLLFVLSLFRMSSLNGIPSITFSMTLVSRYCLFLKDQISFVYIIAGKTVLLKKLARVILSMFNSVYLSSSSMSTLLLVSIAKSESLSFAVLLLLHRDTHIFSPLLFHHLRLLRNVWVRRLIECTSFSTVDLQVNCQTPGIMFVEYGLLWIGTLHYRHYETRGESIIYSHECCWKSPQTDEQK